MLPQNNADRPSKGAVTVYAAMPGSSPVVLKVSPARPWQIAKQLQSFSYDDDGNLTGDGIWDYQYDAENRLIRMASTDASDSAGLRHQVLEFKYDYMGRRVQKRVVKAAEGSEAASDVYVRYVYDGWNVVAEFSATASSIGTMVRSFTWGLDVAGTLGTTGGVGALVQIADHQNGKTYFPSYDGSGNVSSLIDSADGSLAAIYEYSPFGELLRAEGSYAASNPFRFSTKWTDAESGLSYYGYRYYSPGLGRFINRDPIEESGGLNLFGFVGNNPTSRYDVLGLDMVCVEWEFVPMHTGFDANGDPTYMVGERCKTYKWVDPYVVTPRASNAEYYAWLAEQDKQAEIRREMESSSSTAPNRAGTGSSAVDGSPVQVVEIPGVGTVVVNKYGGGAGKRGSQLTLDFDFRHRAGKDQYGVLQTVTTDTFQKIKTPYADPIKGPKYYDDKISSVPRPDPTSPISQMLPSREDGILRFHDTPQNPVSVTPLYGSLSFQTVIVVRGSDTPVVTMTWGYTNDAAGYTPQPLIITPVSNTP